MLSYDRIVWIAGGLLKGASPDDIAPMVEQVADRLAGVVLIGRDQGRDRRGIAATRAGCPGLAVPAGDDGECRKRSIKRTVWPSTHCAPPRAVTVLLAPSAASMDMFRDYADRGDQFTAAARATAGSCDT